MSRWAIISCRQEEIIADDQFGTSARRAVLALARKAKPEPPLASLPQITALLALGHGFSPFQVSDRVGVSVCRRIVEQMVEVGHHTVDQLTPARIGGR